MTALSPAHQRDLSALAVRADAVAPLHVTSTQLDKGIIDATAAIRQALRSSGIHDYEQQAQGAGSHGVVVPGVVHHRTGTAAVEVSLYRPRTKDGDPRLWPRRGFKPVAASGEVWAVACDNGTVRLVPLGRGDGDRNGSLSVEVATAVDAMTIDYEVASAARLVDALRSLRGRRITTDIRGDTAVGMAVERELGIEPNTSAEPDWENRIEIKSKREQSRKSNNTLKSVVPDWDRSPLQHRSLVLDRYGRSNDDGEVRLTNTLRAGAPNSHGLQLRVDHDNDQLWAFDATTGDDVVVWDLAVLRAKIASKHAETFWVAANVLDKRDGYEVFELLGAEHTARPRVWALGALLEQDVVTVDFTMSLKPGATSVRDHGWLFRIAPSDRQRLFPVVARHDFRV